LIIDDELDVFDSDDSRDLKRSLPKRLVDGFFVG
jgi:hypothetical protein